MLQRPRRHEVYIIRRDRMLQMVHRVLDDNNDAKWLHR